MERSARNTSLNATGKVLTILASFGVRPDWRLAELSAHHGLPKSTTHRLLGALREFGFVSKDRASGRYTIGYRVLLLVRLAGEHSRLLEAARPLMRSLAERTEETIFLTAPAGSDSVCIGLEEGRHLVRMTLNVGARAPMHLGASNRILLAHLSPEQREGVIREHLDGNARHRAALQRDLARILADGYDYTSGQLTLNGAAIAVPILDDTNRLIAGLSVGAPADRLTRERALEFLGDLRSAASSISLEIGAIQGGRSA